MTSERTPAQQWTADDLQCVGAAGVEGDVQVTRATDADDAAVDAAYHTKYDRYGTVIVNTVVGPSATQTTLHLSPLV